MDPANDKRADPPQAVKISAVSAPISVPVFNCVVYISRASGQVAGRVANLPDIEFQGDSEPAVLRTLVNEFKRRVANWRATEEQIPWIEPPSEIAANELQRLIPVHL